MSAETILMDAIVIAVIIATLMGTMTVAALLRVARGGGQLPAFSMPGVADRDRSATVRVAVHRPLEPAVSSTSANDHQAAGRGAPALSAESAKPLVAA